MGVLTLNYTQSIDQGGFDGGSFVIRGFDGVQGFDPEGMFVVEGFCPGGGFDRWFCPNTVDHVVSSTGSMT